MREDVYERFWKKVDKNGPTPRPDLGQCWVWTAGCFTQGYGQFCISIDGKRKNWKAHRVSWKLEVGDVPEGLCVLHKCDNRPCVRPSHLFLGTHKDNSLDCISKGRGFLQTDEHPLLKLSDEDIEEIRRLDRQGATTRAIAERFGISRSHVSNIVIGRHRVVTRLSSSSDLAVPSRAKRKPGQLPPVDLAVGDHVCFRVKGYRRRQGWVIEVKGSVAKDGNQAIRVKYFSRPRDTKFEVLDLTTLDCRKIPVRRVSS